MVKEPLVLGIETSGATASVALARGEEVLAGRADSTPFAQARVLERLVAEVLEEADTTLEALAGVAASKGPGSFTGSRLALAAARAYKAALGIPVIGVTSLEALAMPLVSRGKRIVPVIDARRGEVYAAAYDPGEVPVEAHPPRRCRPEALLELTDREITLFAGDGAQRYKDLLPPNAELVPPELCRPRAEAVALIGCARLRARPEGETFAELVPLYLRRSDAELKLDRDLPGA